MDGMGKIEKAYKCAGLCEKEKIFFFSDINYGVPGTSCKDKFLSDELPKLFGNYGIGLLVIGSVLLVGNFCGYAMCCRKKKKKCLWF